MKKALLTIMFLAFTVNAFALSIVKLGPEYFPTNDSSRALANGYIYVGEPDLDPETPANQKTLSIQQESGVIVSVSQPIRTSSGGVPIYEGSPVTLLVDGNYSLLVQNSYGDQEYYVPSLDGGPVDGNLSDYGCNFDTMVSQVGSIVATHVIVDCEPDALSSNLTIPDNITIEWRAGFPLSGPYTITINGDLIAGDYKLFESDLSVAGLDSSNVKWFGAIPDDSIEDTTALNKAIESLSGLGTITVYGGIYDSGKLTIDDGTEIIIDGGGFGTLKKIDNLNDLLIENNDTTTVSYFSIKNITIDGNKSNQSTFSDTIEVFVDRSDISNVTFTGCQGKSLSFLHVTTKASITNCYFEEGAEHTGTLNEGSKYIALRTDPTRTIDEGQMITISDCFLKGIVPDVAGRGVGGILISGNTSLAAFEGHRLHITNNYFENCGQDEAGNVIASVNLYRRAGLSIIQGNRIIGGEHKGIDVQGSPNCIISENIIKDRSAGFSDSAIAVVNRDIDKTSYRCSVVNNIIENWGTGISVAVNTTYPNDGILISGNTIKNVEQFLVIENITGAVSVTSNIFDTSTNTSTSVNKQSIYIAAGDSSVRETQLTFNANQVLNTGNTGLYIWYFGGPVSICDNIIENVGNIGVSSAYCEDSILISGNTIKNTIGRFIAVVDHIGNVMVSNNILNDCNTAVQGIRYDTITGDTLTNGNIISDAPNDIISFDTITGQNVLVNNVADPASTTRVISATLTIDANNTF